MADDYYDFNDGEWFCVMMMMITLRLITGHLVYYLLLSLRITTLRPFTSSFTNTIIYKHASDGNICLLTMMIINDDDTTTATRQSVHRAAHASRPENVSPGLAAPPKPAGWLPSPLLAAVACVSRRYCVAALLVACWRYSLPPLLLLVAALLLLSPPPPPVAVVVAYVVC
jgi:hypothetical protein